MNIPFRLLFGILGISLLMTGCVSKKYVQNQVVPLQAQIGVLTEELVRLDDSMLDVRSAVQQGETRVNTLESKVTTAGTSTTLKTTYPTGEGSTLGVYRTPSGFELPALNIQKALKNAGYYQGRLDGKIGPTTENAVKSFQRDNGLKSDGIVGRNTWTKLKVYLSPVK